MGELGAVFRRLFDWHRVRQNPDNNGNSSKERATPDATIVKSGDVRLSDYLSIDSLLEWPAVAAISVRTFCDPPEVNRTPCIRIWRRDALG